MEVSFRTLRSFLVAIGLLVLLPLAASAYTVVLRSGQRVTIPDRFIVTAAGITYAEAPRMDRTIQMSVINIRATELANREPRGALLAKIGDRPEEQLANALAGQPVNSPSRTARTITNADLDRFRRYREAKEAAYDQQQAARGVPTLNETRELEAAADRRLAERSQRLASNRLRSESYWRERAAARRGELNAIDAQLAVVRSQLRSEPAVSLRAPQVDIDGFSVEPGRDSGYSPQTDSYIRSRLLRDRTVLQQRRAAALVRWNEFEEEARRAGVPPGWLRP